jgi:hypothetical protein
MFSYGRNPKMYVLTHDGQVNEFKGLLPVLLFSELDI